jgi:hypothetical protein
MTMTRRSPVKIGANIALLGVLLGGGATRALADCCSSFLSCAATVVTYGVSCEVQTIITTVENLLNAVNNVKDMATGTTSQAVATAKAGVLTTHDYLQSQSQQGAATLSAAVSQAQTLYTQEKTFKIVPEKTLAPAGSGAMLASGAPSVAPAPATSPRPMMEQRVQSGAPATASAPAASPPGNALARSTAGPAQNVVTLQPTPPPGSFIQTFELALKQVTALQAASPPLLSTVTQDLASVMQSEGSGELTAQSLAETAINAPLKSIEAMLTNMLANPASIFDPSNQVTTVEDSIINSLNTNVGTMVDDVIDGPNRYFKELGPSYGQLMQSAQNAQAIVDAMNRMYTQRTPAAVAALNALLPKVALTVNAVQMNYQATLNVKGANGMSYNDAITQLTATKQKVRVSATARMQQFTTIAAQLKAQIAQGKLAQSPSMLQTYQTSLNQQLSSAFDGKSSSAIISRRDQLISQARTQFAKDPKTESAVIALLNSEAAKRTGMANTSAPATAPVATATAAARQPIATSSGSSLAQPFTAVSSQPAPLVPSAVPISAAPVSQFGAAAPKATAWGTAPAAWTPPAATVQYAAVPAVPAIAVQHTTTAVSTLPVVKALPTAKALPTVKAEQISKAAPVQPSALHAAAPATNP